MWQSEFLTKLLHFSSGKLSGTVNCLKIHKLLGIFNSYLLKF